MTPAERLQAWQDRHGLSQIAAARVCNVPPGTYRNWLKGRAEVPGSVEELTRQVDRAATVGWRLLVEGLAAQLYADDGGAWPWPMVGDDHKRLWRTAAKGCLRRGIRTGFGDRRVTPRTFGRRAGS